MTLKSLKYYEFKGEAKYWELANCDFTGFTLMVGKNATGKSRTINLINGLFNLLSGKNPSIHDSGTYDAEIQLNEVLYRWQSEVHGGSVIYEKLYIDGDLKLSRDETGNGKIYYQAEGKEMAFQQEAKTFSIQQRRDKLQHPYVVALAEWAAGARLVRFNSSFSNNEFVEMALVSQLAESEQVVPVSGFVNEYARGYTKFGDEFDKAILRDMELLGYHLSDVGAGDARSLAAGIHSPSAIASMFVEERDLPGLKITQERISQGMYRALGLVTAINIAKFSGTETVLLIDDIGEGLDYERSSALISLLYQSTVNSNIQAICTTNDRFIMNSVPLSCWNVLQRKASIVNSYTERNSEKLFTDFKYIGLSNFDFFTSFPNQS